jgi:hypothetical protein
MTRKRKGMFAPGSPMTKRPATAGLYPQECSSSHTLWWIGGLRMSELMKERLAQKGGFQKARENYSSREKN